MLSRTVEIRSFRASVRLGIEGSRRPDPEIEAKPWLELIGTLEEPVRDVRDIRISLYPENKPTPGPARPPAVGAIIQTRPELSVVASFSHADFDRVWALALAGHLRHAYMAFTKPRYRTALVLSLSVSNVAEE